MQRLVTFTTDFGVNDHFVGVMKGVIISQNPDVRMVDITHSVPSFDVLDGAMTIAQAYKYFPANSLHVVIVDPGVNTVRRPLLAVVDKYLFLAPDNGVLSLVFEKEERVLVRHITSDHYFLQPISNTFHGRDVFAAVAGYLSKGVEPAKFGEEITDYVRFAAPKPKAVDARTMKGVVLKVDKFGNMITNFTPNEVPALFQATPVPFNITIGKAQVTRMVTAYSQGAAGEVVGILNSMGYLEIAANRNVAVNLTGVNRGAEVTLTLGEAQATTAG